jgi:hypothetical protein
MFKFGWLTITAEDLAIWQQFPATTFTLIPVNAGEDGEYKLGLFDIGQSLGRSRSQLFTVASRLPQPPLCVAIR